VTSHNVFLQAQGAQLTAGCLASECEQGVSPSIQALIHPFYTAGVAPSTHNLQGAMSFNLVPALSLAPAACCHRAAPCPFRLLQAPGFK
jgi:hypothetical protein